jgi:hypothetical protein
LAGSTSPPQDLVGAASAGATVLAAGAVVWDGVPVGRISQEAFATPGDDPASPSRRAPSVASAARVAARGVERVRDISE